MSKVYYKILISREQTAMISAWVVFGMWFVTLFVIELTTPYHFNPFIFTDLMLLFAVISTVCYKRAKKFFYCEKPTVVKAKVLGLGINDFDISMPFQYKRLYAVVKVNGKKYKCYNADGLTKGDEIVCYKYNTTLIPKFMEAKKKNVKHDNT